MNNKKNILSLFLPLGKMSIGQMGILLIGLLFISCNNEEHHSVKSNEIEKVGQTIDYDEEKQEERPNKAQKFYETLKRVKAYKIVNENLPKEILKTYVLRSTSSAYEDYFAVGFSFLELDEQKIKEYDSIILFENKFIELVGTNEHNNFFRSLYEPFGNINNKKRFRLKWPDKSYIDSLKNDTIYENDNLFYEYLKKNYSASSEKLFGDGIDYDSCTFIQEFDNKIVYTQANCSEEGGFSCEINFPKIETETARELMDILFDLKWEPSEDTNVYNPKNIWVTGTRNEPEDGGAGCYYEIEQTFNRTIMKNTYCGC